MVLCPVSLPHRGVHCNLVLSDLRKQLELRWVLPPGPTLREGVDALLPGTQKTQKIYAHVLEGLADAQENWCSSVLSFGDAVA